MQNLGTPFLKQSAFSAVLSSPWEAFLFLLNFIYLKTSGGCCLVRIPVPGRQAVGSTSILLGEGSGCQGGRCWAGPALGSAAGCGHLDVGECIASMGTFWQGLLFLDFALPSGEVGQASASTETFLMGLK